MSSLLDEVRKVLEEARLYCELRGGAVEAYDRALARLDSLKAADGDADSEWLLAKAPAIELAVGAYLEATYSSVKRDTPAAWSARLIAIANRIEMLAAECEHHRHMRREETARSASLAAELAAKEERIKELEAVLKQVVIATKPDWISDVALDALSSEPQQ